MLKFSKERNLKFIDLKYVCTKRKKIYIWSDTTELFKHITEHCSVSKDCEFKLCVFKKYICFKLKKKSHLKCID